MLKIKVLGICFLLSVLICGGGIDCDSMSQAIVGAVAVAIFGVALVLVSNKGEIKNGWS